MESQLRYLFLKMVGEKASQWMSTDAWFIHPCFLTISVDSWNQTWSSLQCAFFSYYNWHLHQSARPVYYRVYTKDGPLEAKHPIYSNDRFISRIASTLVRPPQTAASLTRYLCKIEGLEHRQGTLYQSLSDNTALGDSTRLLFRGTTGPGPSDVDPVALICRHTSCGEEITGLKFSWITRIIGTRLWTALWCSSITCCWENNLMNFQCTIAFTTMMVGLSQKHLSTRAIPLWAVSRLFPCHRLTLCPPWKITSSCPKIYQVTMFRYLRMRAASLPWMTVMRSPSSLIHSQDFQKTSL